jgi:hypothetical protein
LWLPVRLAHAFLTCRIGFLQGLVSALARGQRVLAARRALLAGQAGWVQRQEAFYRRFQW